MNDKSIACCSTFHRFCLSSSILPLLLQLFAFLLFNIFNFPLQLFDFLPTASAVCTSALLWLAMDPLSYPRYKWNLQPPPLPSRGALSTLFSFLLQGLTPPFDRSPTADRRYIHLIALSVPPFLQNVRLCGLVVLDPPLPPNVTILPTGAFSYNEHKKELSATTNIFITWFFSLL